VAFEASRARNVRLSKLEGMEVVKEREKITEMGASKKMTPVVLRKRI